MMMTQRDQIWMISTLLRTTGECAMATISPVRTTRQQTLLDFQNKLVAHPILQDVERHLLSAIREPAGASLVVVYGPTGVGKSTLMKGVIKLIFDEEAPAMEKDPGYIPVAWLEAASPSSGNFHWRDHFARSLEALQEPLIDRKQIYGLAELPSPTGPVRLRTSSAGEPELRYALEVCLRNRRVLAFFIDEAHHMFKMTSGRRRLDQMDTIKSLANLTGTLHVLLGTYELLDMLTLSPQLCRRTIRIHFPRYHRTDPTEHTAFARVLRTFDDCLSSPDGQGLLKNYDYFYDHSLGCVGLLKSWLTRALKVAQDDGKSFPLRRHLEQTRLPEYELVQMARDIARAEEAHVEHERYLEEIRRSLDGDLPEPVAPLPKKRPPKVGRRKPKRDPVG